MILVECDYEMDTTKRRRDLRQFVRLGVDCEAEPMFGWWPKRECLEVGYVPIAATQHQNLSVRYGVR